jgi:hypothetical protein
MTLNIVSDIQTASSAASGPAARGQDIFTMATTPDPGVSGQDIFTIIPSEVMLPTASQQNLLPGEIPAWQGPGVDPYADLVELVRNGARSSSNVLPDPLSVSNTFSQVLARMDAMSSTFTLPDGIERRYNPLTHSNIDVPRGSDFP